MATGIKESQKLFPPIAIGHAISSDWTMQQYHFHDNFEINLSLSGGNRFFINSQVFNAQKGDLFIFNHQDLHKNTIPKKFTYERYLLFFNPTIFESYKHFDTQILKLFYLPRDCFHNHIHLNLEQLLELRSKLDELLFYSKNEVYGKDILMHIRLTEIILLINSYYDSSDNQHRVSSVAGFTKIKPVLTYIDNHLSESIKLDDLAKRFYINKHYLCELFKDVTGFTINQYMTTKRILKARTLLKQGHTVSSTAQQVGYTNDSHFIRTFKNLVGQTPKQYALKS